MFTTFVGTSQSLAGGNMAGNTGVSSSSSLSESSGSSAPTAPKRKRHQVARACHWCRLHRIKCDNHLPCNNCQSRGWQCTNKGLNETRTLPHVYREIERLTQQVRELEEQLKKERNVTGARRQDTLESVESPPVSIETSSSTDPGYIWNPANANKHWDGVHASTAHSTRKTWYGPSSLFYFISRMNTYLTSVFQQPHLDEAVQLNSVAKSLPTPDYDHPLNSEDSSTQEPSKATAGSTEALTPIQEEYFLNLFWQSYHSSLLVLNEVEFKEHWRSLFARPGKPRKPSALVDIVIAISMQYGMASIPRGSTRASSDASSDDPTIAGQWYYRRCQRLLTSELESPTISTLQCQILSVIYLCCASFQNMAHSTLALAARTAQMLGLHLEPAEDMPLAEKEMRKRLYWSLYTVESKTCMKLGRPFFLSLSETMCSLPGDSHAVAMLAGSDFAPLGENVTWLSYNVHNTKLVLAVREVHTALYGKYSDVYNGTKGRVIYDDPDSLEKYAAFLKTSTRILDTWVHAVPDALKTKRKGNGTSFSTDHSPLAVEQFAPLWLQRQRLLLELLYHNLVMNLYRPFITFPPAPIVSSSSSPRPQPPMSLTQSHADSAVNHGMMITRIMHQILSDTDILTGWHEAFQWQWNASITLAGYLFAYPAPAGVASTVREALDDAVAVFDIFGHAFAVANSAAAVMRDLAAKVDFLASKARNNQHSQPQSSAVTSGDIIDRGTRLSEGDGAPVLSDEGNAVAMNSTLPMDIMFSVDSSNNLEMLWPAIENIPDEWGFNFAAG